MTSSQQCPLCGTTTGQHGFSFDFKYSPQAPQKNEGLFRIYIPTQVLVSDDDGLDDEATL